MLSRDYTPPALRLRENFDSKETMRLGSAMPLIAGPFYTKSVGVAFKRVFGRHHPLIFSVQWSHHPQRGCGGLTHDRNTASDKDAKTFARHLSAVVHNAWSAPSLSRA